MDLNFKAPVTVLRKGFQIFSRRCLATHTYNGAKFQEEYWKRIPRWQDTGTNDFLDYKWQTANSVHNPQQMFSFLSSVLPSEIPAKIDLSTDAQSSSTQPRTSSELIEDVALGISKAPMAVRLTPHILSSIDWTRPLDDPLLRQFIPLGSRFRPDHPMLRLDSLNEIGDSPVKGIIHRYPDKVVFLASSVCPVYCRFCTRSYAVGSETNSVSQKTRFLPIQKKWQPMFNYIESTPVLADVLVSGGDGYTLSAEQLTLIGERLLQIPHIRRVRFASKGLGICPSRILDPEDQWAQVLIALSQDARERGKSVALHTHINHPREITWITEQAALLLHRAGVTMRNQTVLLRGVNNDLPTMQHLIRRLADLNIQPYYVLQGDMVQGVEDLRTPLSDILDLEAQIRGTISGFMTPNFIVSLPGGGGKRLAVSYKEYNREEGVSVFEAGDFKKGSKLYHYYDPL
ncbi:MAG: hypothetical protein M1822_000700 [Bathelium mastoideum]|nr:MAG: hypothetical protein M1822_000700 [Bathelium mastoideum]